MNKVEPIDIAKWFANENLLLPKNSKMANMKLQKLLFFSQLIYMAKNNGKKMYEDEFNAFENGMVLEKVRKLYQNNVNEFYDTNLEELNFTEDIKESLILTKEIFGNYTAEELSEFSHQFDNWKKYLKKSKNPMTGWYSTKVSKIPYEELEKELYRIQKVLDAYDSTSNISVSEEEDY